MARLTEKERAKVRLDVTKAEVRYWRKRALVAEKNCRGLRELA